MALTDRNRSIIQRRLSEVVGDEEAVSEMLAHFPVDDRDRPATESDLARTEDRLRIEMRTELADVRTEMRTELADVRTEMRTGFADVRTEMRTGFAGLRTEGAEREVRLMEFVHDEVRSSMRWTIGFVISSQAALVAAFAALT